MNLQRTSLYRELAAEIGNTPLYRMQMKFPHGNSVWVKEENRNPGGSHYDRVFLPLFRFYEEVGLLEPGRTPVVETTSGSAGVSFARLGRHLGYQTLVICPADLPAARVAAIKTEGAEIRFSPAGEYVDGSSEMLKHLLTVENRERKARCEEPYFALNHTQNSRYGPSADISAHAVEAVVEEAVQQAALQGVRFDLCIAAGGNGTTLLGFGRAARRHGFPLVVWESLGSGRYFDRKNRKGAFRQKYGINPGLASQVGHNIYGTVYGPTAYSLPNVETAFSEGVVDYVRIITDEKTRKAALAELEKFEIFTRIDPMDMAESVLFRQLRPDFELLDDQRRNIERAASWEPGVSMLEKEEGKPVGRSSAGNIAMILDEQWRIGSRPNILTFFYDDASRY
ncbi:MAG: pyridoxal-phosphate dependent enzyme [Candidatus Aenigmarchaeota archaeon]|nr:pyridoxal-phosphate dependent enzyme [Candidatus Aenigmarchaeota archaeon]